MQKNLDALALNNAVLAPVSDIGIKRKQLPDYLFEIKSIKFIKKLFICYTIVGVSCALFLSQASLFASIFACFILGLMYAHMVELQHECLHGGAFKTRKLNRLFGVILGIFMFSSHTHYKYDHLLHHSYLGTKFNREFFNYRFRGLNSLWGFLRGAFNLGRYKDVFKNMLLSLFNKNLSNVRGKKWQRMIKNEYRIIFAVFLASVVYTIYTGNLFFVYTWYLPSLLISEAAHFLIEMPEHYGLDTVGTPNVLENTRTIYTNRLAEWFTNGNNLHTAHHYHHRVPMSNVRALHSKKKNDFLVYENSYWSFYKKVIAGQIRFNEDENCMTR